MIRGNNRQKIFYGEAFFDYFLEILRDSARKFDHKILAYCLMSNHIHMIVKVHYSPLSDVMQKINYRYARWANHKMKYIGHLFQGRYHSLEVHDEEYLINLCRYIHFNPIAACLVKKLEEYRWSSHENYTLNSGPQWLDLDIVTRAIKNKTGLTYGDFITTDPDRENWMPALRRLENGEFILDDSILETLKENSSTADPSRIKCFFSIESITEIVCRNLQAPPSELFGPQRSRDISKKRALLISYFLKHTSANMAQIANLFGRNQSTLSRQVKKISNSIEVHFSKQLLKKIDDDIALFHGSKSA